MIEKVTGYPDGRIRNPVKRLRAQPHLIAVADALRVYEGHALVRKFLVGGEEITVREGINPRDSFFVCGGGGTPLRLPGQPTNRRAADS